MKRVFHFSAKVLKTILIAIVVIIVGVAIFLNSNFFDSYIRDLIQTKLGKAIDRKITVESVDFNPFFLDVTLKKFVIGNDPRSPEKPFFAADEIYANVSWRYALAGKVRITEVRLKNPALNISFYKPNGNNWPSRKSTTKKKKGLDIIVQRVDCQDMMITYDNLRIPLTFSVEQLEALSEYDTKQKNYAATTNFKNGYLKIMNFEFWKFDLNAAYRVIGDRVSFEKLDFLSDKSKFYMTGDMYNLKHPFFDMTFHSRIDLTQTRQMFHFGPQMAGGGAFKAVYKGTFESFRMQGHGDFKKFSFFQLPIDQATFDLDMTDNWLDVSNIQAKMFDGGYKGTFSVAPLKGTSIFKAKGDWKDWDGYKLCKLIRMDDMAFPIKGSGSADIEWPESGIKNLTGTMHFVAEPYQKAPVDLTLAAEKSQFPPELFRNRFVLPFYNETSFRFGDHKLQDIKSHLETPYTSAEIQGTIDFSGEANLDVTSHTDRIPEIDLMFHYLQAYFGNEPVRNMTFWGVTGSADFNGKLTKTVWSPFQPQLTGNVISRNAFFHGVGIERADADVNFYRKLIEVYDSNLWLGPATGKVQAKFYLEDKENRVPEGLDLTATVQNLPAPVISHAFRMELPIHGSVNATLSLKGPFGSLEGRSDFEAFRGDMWGQKWDRATGTVLFLDDSLGLRNITAYLGEGVAQASGDLVYENDDYSIEYTGTNLPLDRIDAFHDLDLAITGTANVSGSGSGSFTNPRLQADAKISNLTYDGNLYGDVDSRVSMQSGKIQVAATGITRGITSTVSGEVNLDGKVPFHADFDIQKFPLEIITHAYSPETSSMTGLVGGKFALQGTLYPANVENMNGTIDLIELNLKGVKLHQAHPSSVTLSNNVINIEDGEFVGDHISVHLAGKIYPQQHARLDLTLKSSVDLAILTDWNKDITAHGQTTSNITIGGTLQQPTLTGIMEIKDGFFRHFSFPNSLTDISALVTFKNRNIALQSLSALSSGGKLTAGGTATLKGYSFSQYRFDVYPDKIRVHYPEGLRSTVSGELHLQTQNNVSYLVGDLNILQGLYTRSFEETPDVFGSASVPTFAGLAGAPAGGDINLNIHIHSEGSLFVKNNFANIQSSANANLIGTMNDPVLIGRMEVLKGTITFQDRDYTVVRGSLDLNNPYRTEPYLNFVAQTQVREYVITLNFNGTFDRIYHELSSDPPLPKDDLYALLGVGRTPREIQGTGTTDAQTLFIGQEISRFIASPLTSPLERGFKRALGLQKFTIDPVYLQTSSSQVATARITLQKDISSDFSILYSTNVFTADQEDLILLNYRLSDHVQVTASKDELSRYGVDILVTKTFE